MLQPSCPLRPNNLEERTCLSAELQTYSKVVQEVLYVEIPKTKGVKGLRGLELFSRFSVGASLCSFTSDEALNTIKIHVLVTLHSRAPLQSSQEQH